MERRDQANGFKPKTVATCMGQVTFDVPQVRQGNFYPQSLEKGLRSERALKLALAEMYIQGVSTRAITEKLCGFKVSSTQARACSSYYLPHTTERSSTSTYDCGWLAGSTSTFGSW
ncbi:MAG: transposase [Anaerolineae bacterium]|nr:transposase [Anaerolineae bacterium]